MIRIPGDLDQPDLENRWVDGIWLGKSPPSSGDVYLVGSEQGIYGSRCVKVVKYESQKQKEILEVMTCYDQLGISNFAAVERMARIMQLIEEGYRQKLETKRLEKVTDFAGAIAEHFSGRPRMAGALLFNPRCSSMPPKRRSRIMISCKSG